MFLGPEPKQVVEQYTSSIGPQFLPPYWSLGFQLCRYGYGSLDVVKATVERMDAYQIPLVSGEIYLYIWDRRYTQYIRIPINQRW